MESYNIYFITDLIYFTGYNYFWDSPTLLGSKIFLFPHIAKCYSIVWVYRNVYHLTVDRLFPVWGYYKYSFYEHVRTGLPVATPAEVLNHCCFYTFTTCVTVSSNTAYYSAVILNWASLYGHKKITVLLLIGYFMYSRWSISCLQILFSYRFTCYFREEAEPVYIL